MREVVNAIFYVLRAGCSWRMMPHDLPACLTVYSYFRRWGRVNKTISSTDGTVFKEIFLLIGSRVLKDSTAIIAASYA